MADIDVEEMAADPPVAASIEDVQELEGALGWPHLPRLLFTRI
jgi:hypothetical protein